jgi:hypothetical protein
LSAGSAIAVSVPLPARSGEDGMAIKVVALVA